jgi:hypothetical protein
VAEPLADINLMSGELQPQSEDPMTGSRVSWSAWQKRLAATRLRQQQYVTAKLLYRFDARAARVQEQVSM